MTFRTVKNNLAAGRRPAGDERLLRLSRLNLAGVKYDLGNLSGARELQEDVVAELERTVPEDHLDLLKARGNLAATVLAQGDIAAARALVVYLGLPIADRFTVALPAKWRHVLVWGGLRGSLSMVLILGLPSTFSGRAVLIDLVFGVVSVSLFLQGLTMAPLLSKLGIQHTSGLAMSRNYELARGRAIAFRKVLHEASKLLEQGLLDHITYDRPRDWYERSRRRS